MQFRGAMHVIPLVLALSVATPSATERDIDDEAATPAPRPPDPLFGRGASVTLATGVPFLAIGEAAWGFGDRLTLGAMIGVTPNVLGVGLRPRVSMIEWAHERIDLVVPALYYPETSDGAPWILTRPVLAFSHLAEGGFRFGGGVGFVAASAVGTDAGRPYAGATGDTRGAALWNVVAAHVAFPIRRDTVLFGEAAAILRGARFAGDEWVGGPPLTLSIGASGHVL